MCERKESYSGRTHGSNSWMTLSNLKTEKSLVEKAEEEFDKIKSTHGEFVILVVRSESGKLTEDRGHREDEQLQQRVLLLVGQPQEAHFGHVGNT